MKLIYLIFLVVAISKAQENLAFCDDYIEYNITYYGKFISSLKISNTSDIILAENRLMIIDDELNVLSSNLIPKLPNSTCEWIFNQSPGLFFVGCQKIADGPYLIAYKILNNTHVTQFGSIGYFPNFNQTLNNIKGTLNTIFTVQKQKVTFFKLVMTLTEWSIQTTQYVLDQYYLIRTSELDIRDFQFAPYWSDNVEYYKLFVIDYLAGIFCIDTIVKNNVLQPFQIFFIPKQQGSKITIHSTTEYESLVTFIFYESNYHPYMKITYKQSSLEYQYLAYFSYSTWPTSGAIKISGNIQGLMHRSSNQASLWIYNAVLPLKQDEIGSFQSNTYSFVDRLTSPPQNYSFFYFNSGYRVVRNIENNKLQSCDLYNYKIQME